VADKRQPLTPAGDDSFKTTHWSVVQAACDSASPGGPNALATLCRIYWPPVYSFIRRRGRDVAEAEDLTQSFFAFLLEKRSFKIADRDRGRFRSFLLASLKNFLANEWDRAQALKRGGGVQLLSLDFDSAESQYRGEPSHDATPESAFERSWAISVCNRVLARLEQELRGSGNERRFEELSPFVIGGDTNKTYTEAGKALGLGESAVKVAVHRMRRRFGALLREEIAQTVTSSGDIDRELRELVELIQ
jgi:RNA polymerase sigma-70 factor (ECF subfamily)